jgi:hypothetical protein
MHAEALGAREHDRIPARVLEREVEVTFSGASEALERRRRLKGPVDVRHERPMGLAHDVREDGLTAIIVPVERGRRDAHVLGQLAHGKAVQPAPHVEVAGGGENRIVLI